MPRVRQLEDLLESVLAHLKRLKRPVVDVLLPGLSAAEYSATVSRLSVHPPIEVQRLYRWRNGTHVQPGDSLDDLHIFPGFYWFSLPDAINAYEAFRHDARWDHSWFPLFANGGGDFYAIACSASEPVEIGEIVGFMLGEEEHPVEYKSLHAMAATLDACFDDAAFYVSPEGFLEADDTKHFDIAKRFNGELDFYAQG